MSRLFVVHRALSQTGFAGWNWSSGKAWACPQSNAFSIAGLLSVVVAFFCHNHILHTPWFTCAKISPEKATKYQCFCQAVADEAAGAVKQALLPLERFTVQVVFYFGNRSYKLMEDAKTEQNQAHRHLIEFCLSSHMIWSRVLQDWWQKANPAFAL